ncbi:MAG: hypothetical protein ACXAB7_02565 [Candidatus Kariarchaeaceae archaeon]|jgi:hypothetical protein
MSSPYPIRGDNEGNRIVVTEWEYEFGSYLIDKPLSLIGTKDGGYTFAYLSFETDYIQSSVVHVDDKGMKIWESSYPNITINALVQTSDGGYIFVGKELMQNQSRPWFARSNEFGEILWSGTRGGFGLLNSISRTIDGGYIFAGMTENYTGEIASRETVPHNDQLVMKLFVWHHSYYFLWSNSYGKRSRYNFSQEEGFFISNNDEVLSLIQTDDKGYIAAGRSYDPSNTTREYIHLVKTDEQGDPLIANSLNGSFIPNLIRISDGKYIFTSSVDTQEHNIKLVSLNSTLQVIKESFIGDKLDQASSMIASDEGEIIVGGYRSADASTSSLFKLCLFKVNTDFSLIWFVAFGENIVDRNFKLNLIQTGNDEFVLLTGRSVDRNISLIKVGIITELEQFFEFLDHNFEFISISILILLVLVILIYRKLKKPKMSLSQDSLLYPEE